MSPCSETAIKPFPCECDTLKESSSSEHINFPHEVLEKTISFLPECHHYVLVPKKHTIPDNRPNVTLIKYPFYRNALSNRSAFHDSVFRNILDFKTQDIDFVFCHQPEMLYNIFVAMSDKRYGQVVSRFLFFH